MGVIRDYLWSSLGDGIIPHVREPVEAVFADVVEHKGLPTRQDFRDLRNRVDMVDYNAREVTKTLHALRGQLKRCQEQIDEARGTLGNR